MNGRYLAISLLLNGGADPFGCGNEFAVFGFKVLQLTDVRDFHVGILGLPAVVGVLADPVAAAPVIGLHACRRFLQNRDDPLFGEPFSTHR
jgi:hypothetical protein